MNASPFEILLDELDLFLDWIENLSDYPSPPPIELDSDDKWASPVIVHEYTRNLLRAWNENIDAINRIDEFVRDTCRKLKVLKPNFELQDFHHKLIVGKRRIYFEYAQGQRDKLDSISFKIKYGLKGAR